MSICEYCGRDLPLIVEDKWCSDLCKYAREVYELGEYVVNLFNGKSYRRISNSVIRIHKKTFSRAFTTARAYCKNISDTLLRHEVSIISREKSSVSHSNPIESVRENYRRGQRGRKLTKETCKKIGEARKGYKISQRTREKIGRANSKSSLKKSLAKQGTKNPMKNLEVRRRAGITQKVVQRERVRLGTHNWPKKRKACK
jgi:hypothetical protein